MRKPASSKLTKALLLAIVAALQPLSAAHALSSVCQGETSANQTVSSYQENQSYGWDTAGNMTASAGGGYTTLAYTSFNLPSSLAGGSASST